MCVLVSFSLVFLVCCAHLLLTAHPSDPARIKDLEQVGRPQACAMSGKSHQPFIWRAVCNYVSAQP